MKKTSTLTASEREVMELLWSTGTPLSCSEIVENSPNREWKASYIHLLINSLLKKEAICVAGFKQVTKNYARTFAPVLSREDFMVKELINDYEMNDENILSLIRYSLSQINDQKTIDSVIALCEEYKKV